MPPRTHHSTSGQECPADGWNLAHVHMVLMGSSLLFCWQQINAFCLFLFDDFSSKPCPSVVLNEVDLVTSSLLAPCMLRIVRFTESETFLGIQGMSVMRSIQASDTLMLRKRRSSCVSS